MGSLLRHLASACPSVVLLVLTAVGLGCRATPQSGPGPVPPTISVASESYPAVEKPVADSLSAALAFAAEGPPARPPLQVLSLSGGVLGAPFVAGVLSGWTESGTRPTFDQVTGISSGALIGAYAFLGPKYDASLQRLMLSLRSSDLVTVRLARSLIHDGAFGSSKPSEELIQTEINDCFLAEVRQAHAEGRRLFIGTMCLETKRLVIWDIGAIASSGRPDADELVRKVLLAAISWPGLVPPVDFDVTVNGRVYHEQHYDAGSACMAFVRFGPLAGWPERGAVPKPGWLAGSNLYVLACRKLYSDPAEVPKRAMTRAMTAASSLLEALNRSDIARLHCFCAVTGMRFHMLAVPQEIPDESFGFGNVYPKGARQLFDAGYQMSVKGPPWRITPPGSEPGEEEVPRAGVQLDVSP